MRLRFRSALVALAFVGASTAFAQTSPPVTARHGMVASEEARASRIGVEILQRGGNAIDAAVAVGFALAVTLPEAGNLGGGGFMVLHLAKPQQTVVIDYRETAPAATTPDIFLDERGEVDPQRSRSTGVAVGVPGTVAGLARAHAQYGSGKFSLAELIAPAIRLARDGFDVDKQLAASLARGQPRLVRWPTSAAIFLRRDGIALQAGDRLVQRDLARTLEAIALEGPRAFYEGPIADRIAASVRGAGGRMTRQDLVDYRVREREPVRGSYRGYEIVSAPPPASGGVHLIQMLNVLAGYDLRGAEAGSAGALHLMLETMKLAYADRAAHLGDPDFVRVPVSWLTSNRYAVELREKIDRTRARRASEITAGEPVRQESDQTTHFSVIDRDGNAVSNTYTLNFSFGLGLVAGQTGVLLNNELDDFAAKPGAPNAFGLLGSDANAPAPGKRPVSSMTPTLVLRNGRPVLATGAAGGSRIITTVLQVVVNTIDHGMNVYAAVTQPRVHHQWLPDEVNAEPGVPTSVVEALERMGHIVVRRRVGSSANSIAADGELVGAVDPRSGGLAVGY